MIVACCFCAFRRSDTGARTYELVDAATRDTNPAARNSNVESYCVYTDDKSAQAEYGLNELCQLTIQVIKSQRGNCGYSDSVRFPLKVNYKLLESERGYNYR